MADQVLTKQALNLTPRPAASTPAPRQLYWGTNFWNSGAYVPGDSQGNFASGPYDPNWEAPRAAWSPWDTADISVAGKWYVVPGRVRLRTRLANRVDIKRLTGASGGAPTFLGLDLAEIDMTLEMWTQAHQIAFENLTNAMLDVITQSLTGPAIPKGAAPSQRQAAAFDIQHPALKIIRVDSVLLVGIDAPEPSATAQVVTARFRMLEFKRVAQSQSPTQVKSAALDLGGISSPLVGSPGATGTFGASQGNTPPDQNPAAALPR